MGSRNISAHFTLDDVAHSDKAKAMGWDNTMPDIYFRNAQNLAIYILEPICARLGVFKPSSWYRSAKLNTAVGGSKTSDHMIGAAADIKVPGVSLLTLAQYIIENLQFDQVILEFRDTGGWVHVSLKSEGNRKEVLHTHDGIKYLPGTC